MCYSVCMVARRDIRRPAVQLPQRTLRNEISRVLRDVEAGESFAITVNGRVVAELVPPREQPRGTDWRTAHAFIKRARERHANDTTFWSDIGGRQEQAPEDPWERAAKRST